MLKGVTQRQIIVLYVMLAVLAMVVGVKYLILPMMESNDEKQTQLLAKMSDYDMLVLESQQAKVFKDQNEQLLSDISEVSKSFQSDIKPSNIDSVISSIIRQSGLEAISLNVGEAESVTDTSLSQVQADAQTQTQSGGTEKDNAASEGADAVKSVTTELTTSGSYDQLTRLLKLIERQKAMYIKDLTFTMQVDSDDDEDIIMNFSVVSFVYAPEYENAQETSEPVSQQAS